MEAKKNPAKDVHRYSKLFFMIGLSASSTIMICAFEWHTEKSERLSSHHITADEPLLLMDPPSTQPDPPAPVPLIPLPKEKIIALIPEALTETSTDPSPTETRPTPFTELYNYIPSVPEPEETDDPIVIAEVMPQPIGGYAKFYNDLSRALKYPGMAIRSHIEGRVFLEFVVNQSGLVQDLKVSKGIGYGCDEEAIQVISKSKWEPGKQRGRPVKVRMTLPVVFKLD